MENSKMTFRDIANGWQKGERGLKMMRIAEKTGISYSSICSFKSRGCRNGSAMKITEAMIELGYVPESTQSEDLFPQKKQ